MGELVRKLIREKLESFSIDKLKDMLVECLVDKSVEEFESIIGLNDKTVTFDKPVVVYRYDDASLFLMKLGGNEGYHLRFVKGKDNCLYERWSEYFDNLNTKEVPNAVCYIRETEDLGDFARERDILGHIDNFPERNYNDCLAILRKFLPDVQMID